MAASDDCGFLLYKPDKRVHIEFTAAHPNNRAVFKFNVIRGSNTLGVATAPTPSIPPAPPVTPTYIETTATSAGAYSKIGDSYEKDFTPADLVGSCVNAAFSASVQVYGKATNGYHRLGYDSGNWIAFALALDTSPTA
jgi:hypothetical protein